MRRKVIRQGRGTLTVTLPSSWVKTHELEPGDEIDLLEKDNGLFITCQRLDHSKETSIDITDMDIPTIWKYLMAVYREGYTDVRIRFPPNMKLENPYKFFTHHKLDIKYGREPGRRDVGESLQNFIDRFIGFEIIEHSKTHILVRDMSNPTNKEFDSSLRRVFLLIDQMANDTLEALKTEDTSELSHIHNVDVNLDKFHDYCARILHRIGAPGGARRSELLFATLQFLELIGDEFKNISIHLIQDFPKSKFGNIQEIAQSIIDQWRIFYKLYYDFNAEGRQSMADIDKDLYFKVSEIYKKAREAEKEIFHHFRIVSRYLNSLLELRIEMEYC